MNLTITYKLKVVCNNAGLKNSFRTSKAVALRNIRENLLQQKTYFYKFSIDSNVDRLIVNIISSAPKMKLISLSLLNRNSVTDILLHDIITVLPNVRVIKINNVTINPEMLAFVTIDECTNAEMSSSCLQIHLDLRLNYLLYNTLQ